MEQVKKVNYLNNKDMMLEIHRSKNSYCQYTNPKYSNFDIIIPNKTAKEVLEKPAELKKYIKEAKENRAARLSVEAYETALKNRTGKETEKLRPKDYKVDPDTIPDTDLVFRIHTFEHIPPSTGVKKGRKNGNYVKLNFIPFKHYILTKSGNFKEVGKSHYKDDDFSCTHGAITPKLAHMFILLVNRISQRGNWRGYSYIDEMKGQALLQLSHMSLHFNEAVSDNAFAYFTDIVWNSFTRVLNTEKKNQKLRDEIMIDQGQLPSFTRQLEHEESVKRMREDVAHDDND